MKDLLGKIKLKLLASVGLVVVAPMLANGANFVYQFNNVFNGVTPAGSLPWITAAFSDVAGSPGTVQLKISASGLTGSEFLAGLLLNLDPADNPGKLAFTYVTGSGGFSTPSISTGEDKFKANGDGKYDISFVFSQKSSKTLTGNEWVVYDITSTSKNFTLDASDFDFLSAASCGSGPFLAAAEIMGIPTSCGGSGTGWTSPSQLTPVPEPGTAALMIFGAGTLGLAAIRRKNRKG